MRGYEFAHTKDRTDTATAKDTLSVPLDESLKNDKLLDSVMSLFRGRENEDVRLEIFRTAIGQSTSRASNVRNGEAFKDFLKADLPRVVKATVEGGHKGLLEELVGTLDIPPEVFRQHEGSEIRII